MPYINCRQYRPYRPLQTRDPSILVRITLAHIFLKFWSQIPPLSKPTFEQMECLFYAVQVRRIRWKIEQINTSQAAELSHR